MMSFNPKGVAVVIDAEHQCMSSRGVHKHGSSTITSRMIGVFRENPEISNGILELNLPINL